MVATMSKVELVNNGYEGVVVGVSSRVDASVASEIIAGLKVSVTSSVVAFMADVKELIECL